MLGAAGWLAAWRAILTQAQIQEMYGNVMEYLVINGISMGYIFIICGYIYNMYIYNYMYITIYITIYMYTYIICI